MGEEDSSGGEGWWLRSTRTPSEEVWEDSEEVWVILTREEVEDWLHSRRTSPRRSIESKGEGGEEEMTESTSLDSPPDPSHLRYSHFRSHHSLLLLLLLLLLL